MSTSTLWSGLNQYRAGSFQSFRHLIALLMLTMLSACSLFQPTEENPLIDAPNDWTDNEGKLRDLQNWNITGKIGFRTTEDGGSAAINDWRQDGEFYRVELASTFLGLGSVLISGGADFVSIIESGEEPLLSDQPDQLLEQALGFPLPTRYLPLWIKGIAEQQSEYQVQFGENGLPSLLSQHGWQIRYSRYSQIEDFVLPKKVVLNRGDVKLTLAIKEWSLRK